ncbi:MAG: hypothetical protein P8Y70_06475 [Candidatus Lokiarchaeota archaeon]
MVNTQSEDTLIFNGLSPHITNMDVVYKAIENFCELKKAADPSERFNIILFQEDGPNFLQDFTLNPDHILIALKSLEPVIVRSNIAGGIFVAVTFIIDVFKRISQKTFRLIVLTDEGSLKIPIQYMPALENLVDKVKDMPFFIDIIRLNTEDSEEDEKLMRLAEKCNGNVHEINDMNNLGLILEVLALKREISSDISSNNSVIEINKEDIPFYENLADSPIKLNEESICSICFENVKDNLVFCPRCKAKAHKSCFAQWAEKSNIGIEHVFRCHNCYNLLKLNKEFVELVQYGKIVAKGSIKTTGANFQEYLESLENKSKHKMVKAKDPIAIPNIISNEDPSDLYSLHKKDEVKEIWCPKCFKMINTRYKRCPNCGYIIK